jgi:glucosamine--fructose-6-phosphate aminotransferase (isomerizing)
MCGIVGYSGKSGALPILISGLFALEYRGYDSAGIALISEKKIHRVRSVGPVAVLQDVLKREKYESNIGIGHTRWATHGEPDEKNAHPHMDCLGRIAVVHNGIIENYKEIRDYLIKKGHVFSSETDTEIIPHLIEDLLKEGRNFRDAFCNSVSMIHGAYAIAVLDAQNDTKIYATRVASPLVIGVGGGENFLASDPSALVGKTKEIIYLKDGEIAEITPSEINITNLSNHVVPHEIVELEWTLEQAQKGDFPYFMMKEIFEEPETVLSAMRGRIDRKNGTIRLGGLENVKEKLRNAKRIIIIACGTSFYAGLLGEYLFEEIAGIPTEVQTASDFRYRKEPFHEGTVMLAISQSGETADTLAALKKAKECGLFTLGLVNTVGSSIARETDAGVYNHAGPEIGVASTKAFVSQYTILVLMALFLSKTKKSDIKNIITELELIPEKISSILKQAPRIEVLAKKYAKYQDFFFLGRRYGYPVAMEGALKLKEISYIHAEGYGGGEMKHGPIAMINSEFPTVAIALNNTVSEKMYSNIQEIKARKGLVIAIANEKNKENLVLADDVFVIPETIELLEPLLAIIPLQIFAYSVGVLRGNNIDKPRNLAKSVTVE